MTEYIRGEIFYDKQYIYKDAKEPCDKLLLILNKAHVSGEDVVIVPATTNVRNYPYNNGCNPKERVHYFEKGIGYYGDKTIIQYDFAERISSDEFERRIRTREMKRQDKKISEAELTAILICLKSIEKDIDGEIMELVF